MKKTRIYAETRVRSNSGREYPYAIRFTVEPSGRIHFEEERTELAVRPYMLLHLVSQVYKAMGIDPKGKETAYRENPLRHPYVGYHHPAIEILETGKRYRLDQEVTGEWLNNPDVTSMVYYIRHLKEIVSEDGWAYKAVYVYGDVPGYRVLNPANSPEWTWFAQEL